MDNTDIKLFQSQIAIGSHLLLMLNTRREIEGTLTVIGEHYIILRKKDGGEATYSFESISGWETLNGFIDEVAENTDVSTQLTKQETKIPEIGTNQPKKDSKNKEKEVFSVPHNKNANIPNITQLVPVENAPTPALLKKVFEIEARFKAEIQRATITPIEPVLNPPDIDLAYLEKQSIKASFDRLREIRRTAHKSNEITRLTSLIYAWINLSEKYPKEPVFAFNLGCIYLELSRLDEALYAFRRGGQENHVESFYNLAATALQSGNKPIACYALQEFFCLQVIKDNLPLWHLCVGLSVECEALATLTDVLQLKVEMKEFSSNEPLLEAIVFALNSIQDSKEAYKFAQYLLPPNNASIPLPEVVDEAISNFPEEDSQEYRKSVFKFVEDGNLEQQERQKIKTIQMKLEEAQSLANKGKYSFAIDAIREILRLTPNNEVARHLEAEYKSKITKSLPKHSKTKDQYSDKGKTQPGQSTKRSYFKEATIAEQQRKDFKTAEAFYRKEIAEEGDRWETSIKNLASLLSKRDEFDEAIKLLTENINLVQDKRSLRNVLVNVYQRAGKYHDAIQQLEILLKSTTQDERAGLQKQIAFCYIKAEDYNSAEKTLQGFLKFQPDDLIAQGWLENIRLTKQTGKTSDLGTWLKTKAILTEFETSLSEYLLFHLEQCEYEGVDANVKVTKQFTLRDVRSLNEKADDVGTSTAYIRSQLYLSAAKILMDLGESREIEFKRTLRNFCAAMGDACISQRKPFDIVRSYYTEAFLIAPEWLIQLEVKLAQFIQSFYEPAEVILRTFPPIQIRSFLKVALSHEDIRIKLVEELLHLSVFNSWVAGYILPEIFHDKDLRSKVVAVCRMLIGNLNDSSKEVKDVEELTRLWEQGRLWAKNKQQDLVDELKVFQNIIPTWATIDENIQRLAKVREKLRCGIDIQRADNIAALLKLMINYNSQTAYSEKRNFAYIVQNKCDELLKEISEGPTKISLELFRPYILSLQKFFDTQFEEYKAATEPEISVDLASDEYFLEDKSSRVDCQLLLTNREGKSPASDITIIIKDSPDHEYTFEKAVIPLPEVLQGGNSEVCEAQVKVNKRAKDQEFFTLHFSISYTTDSGKKVEISGGSGTVKLYPESRFQPIKNPYELGAGGQPIEDDDLFVGREQLIESLSEKLKESNRSRSFIIYGQFRSGKTSILRHLKKKLRLPIIPVELTFGSKMEDIRIMGVAALFHSIATTIDKTIKKEIGWELGIEVPSLEAFEKLPQSSFEEYLEKLQIAFSDAKYNQARIVLMLDEVGQLYNEIVKGTLSDTFMSTWKALLESNYFSSIMFGPDVMWKFMRDFSNQFQTAEKIRVDYLSEKDARKLIVEPIKITETKESRFRSKGGEAAIKRIIELTAGNPFFLQRFCSSLVDYMSLEKRAVYATTAYVDEVKRRIVRGVDSWTKEDFDNLVNSGELETNSSIPKEEIWKVLSQIATGSKNQEFCSRSSLDVQTNIPMETILEDLERRKVIETRPNGHFKIKVGLLKEWLLEHEE